MIIMLGIAGSGKTTQGRLLAEHLDCTWLSTGQLLRDRMTGQQAEDLNSGKLVGDNHLLGLLDKELKRLRADEQEMVLDGSPRTMHQAEWLAAKAKIGEVALTAIFHLVVPRDMARERLLERGRTDDVEASIEQRFKEYDRNIVPIMDYFKTQGYTIHEIDGTGTQEAIAQHIDSVLEAS